MARKTPPVWMEVECVVDNVWTNTRQLTKGERCEVPASLGEQLVANKQCKKVK